MQPLLSVIIPVYNVEKYIDECMESIVKQLPGADMEIILVDDGSTDSSGAICDRYAEENPKIKVVHHQKNQNLASARNTGLAHACGRYIAWIDSDDYVSGDWYEKISAALKADESIDLLLFDYAILSGGRTTTEKFDSQSRIVPKKEFVYEFSRDLKIKNGVWNKVYRRSLYDGVTFPVSVVYGEDIAAQHKVIVKAERIYYLSHALYFYRMRGESLTGKINLDQIFGMSLMAKEKYEFLKRHGFRVSVVGYMFWTMDFCMQYHRCGAETRAAYKEKFQQCRKAIRQYIVTVLREKGISGKYRIKFLLMGLNLFRPAMRLHGWMKGLRAQ